MSQNWRPTAPLKNLKARAQILAKIRVFFALRGVMEVETPLMCHATVTDPYIHSFKTQYRNETYYLQTSPEYAMKRLLAAGIGPIYQICKSFRDDESGRYHNPEFTMLEWYRPSFDHFELMNEMDELLQHILNTPKSEKLSYQEAFEKYLGINPLTASLDVLKCAAKPFGFHNLDETDKDIWLQLLMSEGIEKKIGQNTPTFIYHYPASQSALAKLSAKDPRVAERFEVYYKGIELANGFHELQDAKEQRSRFEKDLAKRKNLGYEQLPIDERFLAALSHGLPDCSGVALGLDRLIMLALCETHIDKTLAFPLGRA